MVDKVAAETREVAAAVKPVVDATNVEDAAMIILELEGMTLVTIRSGMTADRSIFRMTTCRFKVDA
jgi:hypothetical protein